MKNGSSNSVNLVAQVSSSILASWYLLQILVSVHEKKMPNSLNFRRYLEDVLVEQAVVQKRFWRFLLISRVFGGNPEARPGMVLELGIVGNAGRSRDARSSRIMKLSRISHGIHFLL